ncbi:hypothetical protein ABVK25_000533 [Lepraria finkii]|uniref:Uncharacterized protein n=1 Tax=Lepraria finkii TaxID=1340010 RepID=A0ABR4BQ59_9LECA
MLGAMKGVKMTGLMDHLSKIISESSKALRVLLVKIVSLSYTSTALTPVVAFGAYIMLAKYNHYPLMDNSRVFTSLALMQLLLEPVAFFITASSGLMSAICCFERIRIYFNSQDHSDSGDFESLLDNDAT